LIFRSTLFQTGVPWWRLGPELARWKGRESLAMIEPNPGSLNLGSCPCLRCRGHKGAWYVVRTHPQLLQWRVRRFLAASVRAAVVDWRFIFRQSLLQTNLLVSNNLERFHSSHGSLSQTTLDNDERPSLRGNPRNEVLSSLPSVRGLQAALATESEPHEICPWHFVSQSVCETPAHRMCACLQ